MAEIIEVPIDPVPEVVDMLERWVEDAKNGNIRSVSAVASLRDNRTRTAFAGYPDSIQHVGCLEQLKTDIFTHVEQEVRE